MPSRDTPTPLIYTATAMYELSIERDFVGAHAITMAGEREATHRHTWHVTVVVAGAQLDADGLLCDFHILERGLAEIVGRFDDADLNAISFSKQVFVLDVVTNSGKYKYCITKSAIER